MFCHRCGTQIAEGAVFCHNCGTKADAGANLQPSQTSAAASGDINLQAQVSNNDENENDFKAFVDEHVRKTTKFQSADDLLVNSKPLRFVLICFVITSVIGIALGAGGGTLLLSFLTFGVFFGYIAVWIASGIIRMRYRRKFSGILECKINPDELLLFLNGHLRYISPDFHEFGYLEQSGSLFTIVTNMVSDAFKEVSLCCEFGPKKKSLATIYIRPDRTSPDLERTIYSVNALRNGSVDFRAAGFLGHSCLIKTAPILQAAMEYYSKNYKLLKENDDNVLS